MFFLRNVLVAVRSPHPPPYVDHLPSFGLPPVLALVRGRSRYPQRRQTWCGPGSRQRAACSSSSQVKVLVFPITVSS